MRKYLIALYIDLGLFLLSNLKTEVRHSPKVHVESGDSQNSVCKDIKIVLSKLNSQDFLTGIKNVLWEDIINKIYNTITKIPANFINTLNIIKKFLISPIRHYKVSILKAKKLLREFKALNFEDQITLIAKLITSFFAMQIGYYTPDLDIAIWGIGSHRHFLTHSIFPLILVNIGFASLKRLIEYVFSLLPQNHNQFWTIMKNEVHNLKYIVDSYSIGLSLHLAEDLLIDGSQTIRGPWSRRSIPDFLRKNYRFDDSYLFINLHESFHINQKEA